MDEFDVGDGGGGVIGHFLFELFDVGDFCEVDVDFEGLFLGGCFEEEFDHLKIYQICRSTTCQSLVIALEHQNNLSYPMQAIRQAVYKRQIQL